MAETEGTYNYDKSPSANSTQTTIQERLLENTCEALGVDRTLIHKCMQDDCGCARASEAATHIDALEKRVEELEDALKDIAGASWGWVAPDYEKGQPMTHKGLTIDRAMKALDIKLNGGAKP